jgi:hypothetical protein
LWFRHSSLGPGDRAASRFLELFTVDIRNRNTRATYARVAVCVIACMRMVFGWLVIGQAMPGIGDDR